MDFHVSETQGLLRQTTERLVRDRYNFQARKALLSAPTEAVADDWSLLGELGLAGVAVPEALGGMGGDFHDVATVLEALGAGFVIEPFLPTVVLFAGLVAAAGGEDQRQAILPRVAAGELLGAFAYSEPQSRYRLNDVTATAEQTAGGFVLSGDKALVLGGGVAGMFVVSARTRGERLDADGVSLFLVPRDTPGLMVTAYRNLDLTGAADLSLRGVRVPAGAVMGELHQALPLIEQAVDRGIAGLCAEAVGAMTALQTLTLDYIKQRHAFGQPLGGFQVLQHKMADIVVACEQARSMMLLAADEADGTDPARRAMALSGAKVQIGESARLVGREAMQMHGGMAITLDYPAGYYHKRLTVMEHLFGDVDFHARRYALAAGY